LAGFRDFALLTNNPQSAISKSAIRVPLSSCQIGSKWFVASYLTDCSLP
jgi:hypothetical protein